VSAPAGRRLDTALAAGCACVFGGVLAFLLGRSYHQFALQVAGALVLGTGTGALGICTVLAWFAWMKGRCS
jgi:hypothetical protein